MPTASAAPAGQISGTVTNAVGDTLSGITVTAYGTDTGEFGDEATTKKDGTYALKKLGAADYTVEFMDNSGTPRYATEYYDDQVDFEAATPVTVAASQTVSGIDAEAGAVRHHQRQGHRRGGQPARRHLHRRAGGDRRRLRLFDSPGGTTTAANGTYSFPFTPAGTYVVGFTDLDGTYVNEYYDDQLSIFDADPVTVTAGGVTPAIDAELALGGHLSGTVTVHSEGNGLGGIEIQLAREVGPDEWFGSGEEFGFRTEDDGTYQLDGLPAGTWRVGFVDQGGSYLSEYYDDVPEFEQSTNIPVSRPATRPPASTRNGQTPPTSPAPSPTRGRTRSRASSCRCAPWRRATGPTSARPRRPRTARTPWTGSGRARTTGSRSSRRATGPPSNWARTPSPSTTPPRST